MSEQQAGSLFEPAPKDPEVTKTAGWSYVNRPVDQPQMTPIYEQLVQEHTSEQPKVEEPATDEPADPVIGKP
jgi:hypothetical protein